jgi:hypothetical protein
VFLTAVAAEALVVEDRSDLFLKETDFVRAGGSPDFLRKRGNVSARQSHYREDSHKEYALIHPGYQKPHHD